MAVSFARDVRYVASVRNTALFTASDVLYDVLLLLPVHTQL